MTNGLEFGVVPAVGKKDATEICTTYHHPSSKQGRSRTKALTNLAFFDRILHGNLLSTWSRPKKRNPPFESCTERATDKQKKQWAMQQKSNNLASDSATMVVTALTTSTQTTTKTVILQLLV